MNSPIPPFDFDRDPLARNWQQPDHTRFLWLADAVFVTPQQHAELLEYSSSMPSGVYPGKCWRRDTGKNIDPNGREYLAWYVASRPDGAFCSVNFRRLFVLKPPRLVAQDLLRVA